MAESPNPIRLCLVLHNHQPVGNFDHVIETAYQDSYLPFLDLFESYPGVKIGLHTSGPLLLWLQQRHPDYLKRVRSLVRQGRIEIIGGAFYEPILTMIPSRDRQGQIRRFSEWLHRYFDTPIRGMWIPERVWEPELVRDIVASGIRYTVLDDYHFRCAGLEHDELHGDYVTEDQGVTLRIFPGSEPLRYTIPFRDPHETIHYLREIAQSRENATVVFADDGEKFGSWPDTKKHVYDEGWLRSFFEALAENRDWLICSTLGETVDQTVPEGKIYLPSASYREMTEWSLPADRQLELDSLEQDMHSDWRWPKIRKFIHGGFWRNFKAKYPETNEMYARMMHVSRRLDEALSHGDSDRLDQARERLYRGQCNCAYWHGAFGGVYLPHLRNAVYQDLIHADNLIDLAIGRRDTCSIEADDYNYDLSPEIRLANQYLVAWLRPSCGGHLYELDVRSLGHNLLATMDRRPEAYHEKVRQGGSTEHDSAASIHDQVIFKQEGLDQRLQYDATPCKSLVDHFWQPEVSAEEIRSGRLGASGPFAMAIFESTIRRSPERHQLLMNCTGQVEGHSIRLTKGVTLEREGSALQIAYLLENLPEDHEFRLGVEFNFAGMPADTDDRYFLDADQQRLGHLGTPLELENASALGLRDQWLNLDVGLNLDRPATWWTMPVATVNGSEGGFELVHQSVKVIPNWLVRGDAEGRWAVKMTLDISGPSTTESEDVAAEVLKLNVD